MRAVLFAFRKKKPRPSALRCAFYGQVVEAVRGELSAQQRANLSTVLTLDVHCRDIVDELVTERASSLTDFVWLSQLRSYWLAERLEGCSLQLRMLECSLDFGFEFLGTQERLVVTPLTDRCYRTLMSALHFQFGGAPEGPAGTGKTETTKDLARAAGKHCLVFNCSEGLDASSMASLLKGVAASGGWCCFDEFNRMQLDVLSVVASQISTIQNAIRRQALSFAFEDTDLRLDKSCAINITLNPGYAGRSALPESLKVCPERRQTGLPRRSWQTGVV